MYFSNQFMFLKEKMYLCTLLKELLSLSFGQNHNKISNIKNGVLCNVWNEVD
jgi:hypothetical protein